MHRVPRALTVLAMLTGLGACAGRSADGGGSPGDRRQAVARPLEVYRKLGFIAGPAAFPAVANYATLAGPADSSLVILSLSLPNDALRFQRDANGFMAQYRVRVAFMQDSQAVRELQRVETVRVPTFAETGRSDESVVFQAMLPVPPGTYRVNLEVRDALGARGFESSDTLVVPVFGAGGRVVSDPVAVYSARGRDSVGALPDLVVNPRHTLPYGADTARVYVERYTYAGRGKVALQVVDDEGKQLWSDSASFQSASEGLGYAVLSVPQASLPLGRVWIQLGDSSAGEPIARSPLLVTISDEWMIANFEDVLQILSYIASSAEIDSIRAASGSERRERWETFWRGRDPLPATPANEYRDEFFERVRFATVHFTENGQPGWRSDRGEVYVVLGPPTQEIERQVGRSQSIAGANAIEWIYDSGPAGHLELIFVDRQGFGRFELTPQSDASFRSAARRIRSRR